MNTWPGGQRRALDQSTHEAWNTNNYPGTRQLCCICDEPTGRCEDDSIYLEEDVDYTEPVCWDCYLKYQEDHDE